MKQIRGIRNRELRVLRTIGFWTACFMFTFNCAPTLVSDQWASPLQTPSPTILYVVVIIATHCNYCLIIWTANEATMLHGISFR